MKRFWISWCTCDMNMSMEEHDSFKWWITGDTQVNKKPVTIICAVVDAESDGLAWTNVAKYFPILEMRFCEEKPIGWQPGDGFE